MKRLRVPLIGAVAIAAALTIAACGGDDDNGGDPTTGEAGGGTETITFIQPIPESLYFYPLTVGRELGYFEQEGVEVELLPASEDLPLNAFVSNGDADIAAVGASELFNGLDQGEEYLVIYDEYTRSAESLVVPEDSELQSADELEGQVVGLSTDEDRAFMRAVLGEVGLDPDAPSATPVVGTSGPIVANAIRNGDIDAYSGAIIDFAALEANGITVRDITPSALASTPAASFIALPEVASEKAEAITGFLRAWAKATYVGIVNRDVVEMIMRQTIPEEWRPEAVGQAALDISIEYQTPPGDVFGELRPDAWAASEDQLFAVGEVDEVIPVEDFLDDQFIGPANDWDREEVQADAEQWLEENG